MYTGKYLYHHGSLELQGYVAYDDLNENTRPAILVVHDWSGRNEFACQKAEMFAKMGYVGFAVDMYGHGRMGETDEQKQALMQPLVANRSLLRDRLRAALDTVLAMREVDKKRVAIIGFCFGGLCALDLARSGVDIRGAISVHGLLNKPDLPHESIKAKILALHGYDDPLATPPVVQEFCEEMTKAEADWQIHMYGHTQHAFTNPQAHSKQKGLVYNAQATRRAMQAVSDFLEEIF